MNSPFANIFFSLSDKILSVTGDDDLPLIKYVDMDYGQLEMPERPNVGFPCILIDFPALKTNDLSALVQECIGTFTLKLSTDPYADTSSITPDIWRKDALKILDIEWRLYKALHGWAPAVALDEGGTPTQNTRTITRTNIDTDSRRPGLKVRILTFQYAFTDFSAKRATYSAPATPSVIPEII